MATYKIGDHKVRRKNLYMPCIIGPRIEQMTDEQYAAILQATAWADLITNAEWEALLGHDGATAAAKSRLKKKAAHWLIALGRIAYLNPELFKAIAEKAVTTYAEQVEDEYPRAMFTAPIWGLKHDPEKLYEIIVSLREITDDDDEKENDNHKEGGHA